MLPSRFLILAVLTTLLVSPQGVPAPTAAANPVGTGVVISTLLPIPEDHTVTTPSYVELFNPTSSAVSLTGWSLQLRSEGPSGNSSYHTLPLSGVIPASSYYLVEGSMPEDGRPLPVVPDQVASPSSNFTVLPIASMLVLADTTDAVPASGDVAGAPHIVDAVGWGGGSLGGGTFVAPGWEGSGPVNPATVFTTGLRRSGCGADSDDNPADFIVVSAPALRNSTSARPAACAPPCKGQVPTIAGQGSITGTAGDDVISGSSEDDVIDGGGGNDLICALAGDDAVSAAGGDDIVWGGAGNDSLSAGTGEDSLHGGADDDVLTAGIAVADLLGDALDGGAGDDVANGGPGADAISGGVGSDTLQGRGGTDTLVGGADADDLTGGAEGDILVGSTGNDDLAGGAGDDDLSGRGGDDSLRGGDGDDTLRGGTGTDFLDGGSGTNVLVP